MSQRPLLRSRIFLVILILGVFDALNLTAHAQIVRNRLPLVTKQSRQADRLYFSLQQKIKEEQQEGLPEQVEELRRQYVGLFIAVSAHRHVEASYLADLISFQVGINPVELSPEPLTSGSSIFQLYRAVLRGRVNVDVLLEMGDQLWSHGKIEKAQQLWSIAQRLLSKTDSPSLQQTSQDSNQAIELHKRRIVANIFTGRLMTAERQIDQLNSEHPQVVGRLAGQSGPLAEILSELAHSLDRSDATKFIQIGPTLPFQIHRYDLLSKRWQSPLSLTIRDAVADVQIWKDVVIVHDQAGVRALSRRTGNSAWPAGENDSGLIFETEANESSEISLVTGQSTIQDGFFYMRTGVEHFADQQKLSITQLPRISALNLNAEGRLEWTVTPQDCLVDSLKQQATFSGPPVLLGENLIVPMRSDSPRNLLLLVSLNMKTGQTVWENDIASSFTSYHPEVVDQLAVDGDRIYWLIDGHVLSCIDSRTGNGLWFSAIDDTPTVHGGSEQKGGQLLIVDEAVICTARTGPTAFNKFTGEVLWSQPMEAAPRQLVGSCDDVVLLANPGLYGLDLYTGRLLWNHPLAARSHETYFTLLGRSANFASSNSILTVDALTGSILQQNDNPLRQESEIRSVFLHDKTLFIQQNRALIAIDTFPSVN